MKTKLLLAICLLITGMTSAQWTEVGDIIVGESPLAFFGESVTISGDGNYMAAGQFSRGSSANADLPAPVIIYERNGVNWTEIDRIDSPVVPDGDLEQRFGEEIELSYDGSRLVIGNPKLSFDVVQNRGIVSVYERQEDNSYTQLGTDIVNPGSGSYFGGGVSISSDGTTVAVGRPFLIPNGADEGLVYTFRYDGNDWVQFGQVLGGNTTNDLRFGESVSLDEDGSILIVGIQRGTDSAVQGGMDIYEYDDTSDTWMQLGNRVIGDLETFLGSDLEITPDGNTLIVGASANLDIGEPSYIEVYQREGDVFVLKGNRVESELGFQGYRESVSITDDGNTIAFGAPLIGDGIENVGNIKIYNFQNGDWVLNDEFFGEIIFEALGTDIAISGDGAVIVSGGPFYDPTNNNDAFGGVRTYINTDILSVEETTFTTEITAFPNPVHDILTVNLGENQAQVTMTIYDLLGRAVVTRSIENQNTFTINMNTLPRGMYIGQIASEIGNTATIRLIKQ
ncbi:T9SS type A sorting domain-containing protein [uncultured Dokdonia sp.]|uniref:T9SS type A sorting domain-containing protein n=1 Tax=uncultured Dokdonia sp. TaxID=575653 RepID=UPI00260DEE41|nr:T9SS type A sorting domain-containing protein [uncultured Dokdonia sp.]